MDSFHREFLGRQWWLAQGLHSRSCPLFPGNKIFAQFGTKENRIMRLTFRGLNLE